MTEYQKHNQQAKAKHIVTITLGTLLSIAMICLVIISIIGCAKPKQEYIDYNDIMKNYGQKELVCEDDNLYAVVIGQKKQLLEQSGCKNGKVVMTREF